MNWFQKRKITCLIVIVVFLFSGFSVLTHSASSSIYVLPPPDTLTMSIDEIIQKRTSIREFTDTPLTENELSTLLWHACGRRTDGLHTTPSMQTVYAVIIYVLMQDGIYRYEPENHTLLFYVAGDYRSIGQYQAPVQLGLCWDTIMLNDKNIAGMQIGAVGQNIYHSCIALGLGTVATAEIPCPLDTIGLPDSHQGMIVMPVGHPTMDTKYLRLPLWISPFPKVQDAGIPFTSTVQDWNLSTPFMHPEISDQLLSQFLWACYGYSYYLDHSTFEMHFIERHRTVPSAHGYYPLEIYAITAEGVFWYIPGLRNNDPIGLPIVTFLWKTLHEDVRKALAVVTENSVKAAPVSFLICLNIEGTIKWDDLSDPVYRWIWTYEAGSCIQNVLLDTAAWDYSIKIHPVEQKSAVNEILGLSTNYDPFVLLSIG